MAEMLSQGAISPAYYLEKICSNLETNYECSNLCYLPVLLLFSFTCDVVSIYSEINKIANKDVVQHVPKVMLFIHPEVILNLIYFHFLLSNSARSLNAEPAFLNQK